MTIKSITYKFIWGSQKEVAWRSMVRPKKMGELGVRDYRATQTATIIDRACRMWEGEGIWNSWMSNRYVKKRAINMIEPKQGDSSMWKSTLRQREQISKCVELDTLNQKKWIGKGAGNSIKNATDTLRPELPRDELAKGIWANMIGKVALNLWRIRRRNLPTKDRLINRGMQITGECSLCDLRTESIDHLFFGCDYSRWVLREAMEATGSLVNTNAISSFEEAATELNKVTPGSPPWGL